MLLYFIYYLIIANTFYLWHVVNSAHFKSEDSVCRP